MQSLPENADIVACEHVLEQAEQGCLVANSLDAVRELQIEIVKARREPMAAVG